MLKHNTFFEGNVQSIEHNRNGRRMTVGVVDKGEFHFDARAPERMTVVGGELQMRFAGGEWRRYAAGTYFEVPANTGFDVRADEPSAYLCEFL